MAQDRSAERPWLAAYPPGIPADIDVDAVGTVVDLFDRSVLRFAERPAITCFGASLRYREVGAAERQLQQVVHRVARRVDEHEVELALEQRQDAVEGRLRDERVRLHLGRDLDHLLGGRVEHEGVALRGRLERALEEPLEHGLVGVGLHRL